MQLTEGEEDFSGGSSRRFALPCKALSTLYRSLQVIQKNVSTANQFPTGYSSFLVSLLLYKAESKRQEKRSIHRSFQSFLPDNKLALQLNAMA